MRDFAWTVSQSTSARRMLIESTSKYISDVGDTNFGEVVVILPIPDILAIARIGLDSNSGIREMLSFL